VGVGVVSAPRGCRGVGPGLRACVVGCLAACVRWVGALGWGAGGVLGVRFRAALDVGGVLGLGVCLDIEVGAGVTLVSAPRGCHEGGAGVAGLRERLPSRARQVGRRGGWDAGGWVGGPV
jgi:hypothetical protein